MWSELCWPIRAVGNHQPHGQPPALGAAGGSMATGKQMVGSTSSGNWMVDPWPQESGWLDPHPQGTGFHGQRKVDGWIQFHGELDGGSNARRKWVVRSTSSGNWFHAHRKVDGWIQFHWELDVGSMARGEWMIGSNSTGNWMVDPWPDESEWLDPVPLGTGWWIQGQRKVDGWIHILKELDGGSMPTHISRLLPSRSQMPWPTNLHGLVERSQWHPGHWESQTGSPCDVLLVILVVPAEQHPQLGPACLIPWPRSMSHFKSYFYSFPSCPQIAGRGLYTYFFVSFCSWCSCFQTSGLKFSFLVA